MEYYFLYNKKNNKTINNIYISVNSNSRKKNDIDTIK